MNKDIEENKIATESEASGMPSFQPSPALLKLREWRDRIKRIFSTFLVVLLISTMSILALSEASESILPLLISVASVITSASALIGFILTTILAWRKEKRELRSFDLDNAKKELEIAKLRAELDKVTKPDRAAD